MIKDEYSGKLFAFPLRDKTQDTVFLALQRFEAWVRRKWRLNVTTIRSDNDTSVISRHGETSYTLWAKDEGIDLELAPPQTSESNGGSERAGQEIINRALKMRLGANPQRISGQRSPKRQHGCMG